MLDFSCDYNIGAHEEVLKRLLETNNERTGTYGFDIYTESAKKKIREACKAPDARVHLLVGGTQTNSTVLAAILNPFEGVISATTGHIAVHEAGAVEYTGHKVLTIPSHEGKVDAGELSAYLLGFENDETRDHMVKPGALYISQPTEYGTVYSKPELETLSKICKEHSILLYIDGARLGYALVSDSNLTLPDIAALCDAFYIGGTKLGALCGEAVVITNPTLCPHFFTTVKQHGALLAKGRVLGVQFDALFTDDLYFRISRNAVAAAMKLKEGLRMKGYPLHIDSPTNQQFIVVEDKKLPELRESVKFDIWEKTDADHTVIRLVTNFATTDKEVDELLAVM